ncbi:hypothetical protein RB595_008672 [Gaeumannomyces hyphopodioides]
MQLLSAVLLLAASALVSAAPQARTPTRGAAGTPGVVPGFVPGQVSGGAVKGAPSAAPSASAAPARGRPNRNNGRPNNQAPNPSPTPSPTPNPTGGRPAGGASISADLVPSFGIERGVNANARQRGSCDGANGVLISCSCPPDRAAFIAKLGEAVAQGNVFGTPITFDTNPASQGAAANRNRATAMLVVLQSFDGAKGVGCPGAAAPNFVAQQKTGVRSR